MTRGTEDSAAAYNGQSKGAAAPHTMAQSKGAAAPHTMAYCVSPHHSLLSEMPPACIICRYGTLMNFYIIKVDDACFVIHRNLYSVEEISHLYLRKYKLKKMHCAAFAALITEMFQGGKA